jgi:hypothetical protein
MVSGLPGYPKLAMPPQSLLEEETAAPLIPPRPTLTEAARGGRRL